MSSPSCSPERWINENGYVCVGHNFWGEPILEHRQLARKHYPARLSGNLDVHHIDGDKTNNSLDNLQVVPHEIHFAAHEACGFTWPLVIDNPTTGKPYPTLACFLRADEQRKQARLKGLQNEWAQVFGPDSIKEACRSIVQRWRDYLS